MTVPRDLDKSQGSVELVCCPLRRQGVESDPAVSRLAGQLDDSHGQLAADPPPPSGGAHEQPLHFRDVGSEPPQADAADDPFRAFSQQESTGGRGVVTRESGDFLVEGLEREVDPDAARILGQQGADGPIVVGEASLANHTGRVGQ